MRAMHLTDASWQSDCYFQSHADASVAAKVCLANHPALRDSERSFGQAASAASAAAAALHAARLQRRVLATLSRREQK